MEKRVPAKLVSLIPSRSRVKDCSDLPEGAKRADVRDKARQTGDISANVYSGKEFIKDSLV